MASFSFLHAADIHLDSPLTGLSRYDGVPAEEVRQAPRAAFDRLIRTAIDRQVAFVIIAGDLYDGDWKDAGTGLYFARAMGLLARHGIPVYLLAGNHDAVSVITRELPPPENVRHFPSRKADTHLIPHLGVAIHGRSFADRVVTENLAAGYPAALPGLFNIGVLHTSLGGYAEHETYAPCTPAELAAKRYDYWALGHVHEHQIVSTAPHIVFPGNLQGRNIREDGPRGAVLVEVQDGEVAALTRLDLDVVRWARVAVAVDGIDDRDVLHGRIAAALRAARDEAPEDRKLIVRLTLSGQTALHGALQDVAARLRDDVRGLATGISSDIWVEKVRVKTTEPRQAGLAPDTGDISRLIPPPDQALADRLQAALAKFLAAVPTQERDSLVRGAAEGDWTEVMRAAGEALRHRLGEAG